VKLDNHDPRARRYIEGVLSGSIVTGRLIHLAVQRHVDDLGRAETDPSYPYRFDEDAAQIALDFCGLVRHWKGEWAGKVFEPRDDQSFFLSTLFGWLRRADGQRRFREFLYEIGKKNGKTFMAAVVALLLLVLDCEPGAEVYSTATKLDQAKLAWMDAKQIVRASPELRARIAVPKGEHAYTMWVEATTSKYAALSAESQGADGLMPSGVINDELHRQVDRTLYDLLKYGSRSRRQPVVGHFTTAGDESDETLYAEIHDYAVQILEGIITGEAADEFLAIVYCLDPADEWRDPDVWVKANPGLGVNVRLDDLRKDCDEAISKPAAEAAFKRLRLNIRTTTTTPWIAPDAWAACRADIDWSEYAGRKAFAGLDLSTTTDLTAFAEVFPEPDGRVTVRCFAWCPEEGIRQRADRDRVPYDLWAQQGWIKPTPGRLIDYAFVNETIRAEAARVAFAEIGYDQAHAHDVAMRMADDGLPCVSVPQGPVHMTMPISRLEDLVTAGMLRHDGNPLLAWCINNAHVKDASGGLKRLVKTSYRARIDGTAAVLIALRRWLDLGMVEKVTNSYGDAYDQSAAPETPQRPVSGNSYVDAGEWA